MDCGGGVGGGEEVGVQSEELFEYEARARCVVQQDAVAGEWWVEG